MDRVSEILRRKGATALKDATRHRTISTVLDASLKSLAVEDRTRLAQLSIFTEDIPIPINAAATLWRLDDLDSEDLAQQLARLCLLKLDLEQSTLRLHDVMRQWLAAQVANPAAVYSRVVDAWPD